MKTNPFGSFLKRERIRAGLSQGDVSRKLGYTSPQYVSNWERGVSYPPYETLKFVASLYKIDIKVVYHLLAETRAEEVRREIYKALIGEPESRKRGGRKARDPKRSLDEYEAHR
nr:hypothetical protein BdHM001_36590 [Bdellovibrio sp. HM001]